jgi:hypothetical protein
MIVETKTVEFIEGGLIIDGIEYHNVAKPNACPQLYEGWRDANKELPPEKVTENIWEKGMSDNVLIFLEGSYHIACYHHRAEKWMIPGFCGEWKPKAWKKITPPSFV